MTTITCSRTQYAVGQGGFHSSTVSIHNSRFEIAYDCGSRPVSGVEARVRSYAPATRAEDRKRLRYLFLSHLDLDHVNGIPTLLEGANVDTVFMPYLTTWERLLLIASAESDEAFYVRLLSDPSNTLHELGVLNVLYVRRGDEPPPVYDGTPNTPKDNDFQWEGELTDNLAEITALEEDGTPYIKDTDTLTIRKGMRAFWYFRLFVQEPEPDAFDQFKDCVRDAFKEFPDTEQGLLTFTRQIIENLDQLDTLKSCYSESFKSSNWTSMCLYSGPSHDVTPVVNSLQRCVLATGECFDEIRAWRLSRSRFARPPKIAWLGTGDATLKQKRERDAFIKHYEDLLPYVTSFVLPHHGSKSNFHERLLDHGDQFIVSAKTGSSHHPAEVVKKAANRRGLFVHVSESEDSEFMEEHFIR